MTDAVEEKYLKVIELFNVIDNVDQICMWELYSIF
jgi:hypothetical protein